MDPALQPLADEASRLEESVMQSGQNQFEQAKFWRGINLLFGIPAAALAAISGGTGLAGVAGRVPAAVLALVAAGFSGALTTLNAARRTTQAHATANAYLGLQADLRQFRLIDVGGMKYDEARTKVEEMTLRWKELNTTADIPSLYAYVRGRRNIKKGRQQYEVDGV